MDAIIYSIEDLESKSYLDFKQVVSYMVCDQTVAIFLSCLLWEQPIKKLFKNVVLNV